MKTRGFFHAEAYLPKILVKMSQMNAINVLMFHFWHFVHIKKKECNKDRSSDPWIALSPAARAATAGHSAGGKSSVQNQPRLGSFKSILQSF